MSLQSVLRVRHVALICACLTAATAPAAAEQPQNPSGSFSYRDVYLGDIILGYVPSGERIETTGDLRWTGSQLLLGVSPASAMVPLVVNVSALPAEQIETLHQRCAAARGRPGCTIKIRAQVGTVEDGRGLIAHAIELR